LTALVAGTDAVFARMPTALATSTDARLATKAALLQRRRGWFFGLSGDGFVKYVFQANAAISIVVLALITFTIFKDAVGFLPQNRENLSIYRLAGLEYVDIFRTEVTAHRTISRYLASIRSDRLAALMAQPGMTVAAANAELAAFDDFANRFADTISDQETILGNMTDLATSVKERQKVSEDLVVARQNYLEAIPGASPDRAAELRQKADEIKPVVIDFRAEIQPLLAMHADIVGANGRLLAAMKEVAAQAPAFSNPALAAKMTKFQGFVRDYAGEVRAAEEKMAAWDQTKPISWYESFNAFAFGREWITASFWQDWYGVLPLFTGSLLIATIALLIAIPLGVMAAVYVNQVARPIEQKFIKPYIEFISAIPSVVLGFFGIAMLGETLRRVSQMPSLSWLPGFPWPSG
jgi:phosphate transport system permease protein